MHIRIDPAHDAPQRTRAAGQRGWVDRAPIPNSELPLRPELAPVLRDVGTLPNIDDANNVAHSASSALVPVATLTPLHHNRLMPLHSQAVCTDFRNW